MSYPPYQGNSPYGGGGYPPPQQGGYGPPQGYPPQQQQQQQQYGHPPQGQYQQHQQQYPPQHGGYPPQGGPGQYNTPPPGQGYGPPPGQYGPPQGQYGPPHGQYGGGAPPPQHGGGQYGQPSYGGGFGGAPTGPPEPPTPGYGPQLPPQLDPSQPADELRRAMKGFGTDEAALIRVLAHFPGPEIMHLKTTFQQRHHRSLEADVKKETSGHFEDALLSILRGPLMHDVYTLNRALKGVGTNEHMVNDVLLCRKNADLRAIKAAYHATYNRTLEKDVAEDLSLKTERLFSMVLAANRQEESSPLIPQSTEADIAELHRAMEARGAGQGADQLTVCSILSGRSSGQIRAIAQGYEGRYRAPLESVIKRQFSGHMQEALVEVVRAACDPAMRDAIRLEECMAGPGTKDDLLVERVVGMHWDRGHMQQVKGAYRHRYKRELVERVRGETSGDYERVLVGMIE